MTGPGADPTAAYYDTHAPELAERYSRAQPTYLAHLTTLLREPGARVLDVGCGTGRDVASLLADGYDAHGVDPSARMLEAAAARYRIDPARLTRGELPSVPANRHSTYDAVLCAAVLQHIADERLLDSLYRLRSLVAPGGFLVLSVPTAYPAATDSRDAHGRLVRVRPPAQYRFFLERLGMHEVVSYEERDGLSRDDVQWQVLVFGWTGSDALRPIEVVESILWDDRKVNTYKFALLRAIAHLATHRPNVASWERDGRVCVPMDAIADLWIRYYWPLMESPDQPAIIQGHRGAKADVAFRSALTELVSLWHGSGGQTGFEIARDRNELNDATRAALARTRSIVRTAIKQPVKYAGSDRTGKHLFAYDHGRVYLPESIWRESALLGRWIEDSLVIRWAEFTTDRDPSLTTETVLQRLLHQAQPDRDTARARYAFNAYARSHTLRCAWTNEPVRTMHVDHAIPWSLWRSNDLWNLLPVESRVNTEKGARLPSRRRVEARRTTIIASWEILFNAERETFLTHAHQFAGKAAGRDFGSAMQDVLFNAFKDALEYTAVNRGVERW